MDFYPFNVAHEDPGPTQWHRRNQVNLSMFTTSSTPCSLRRQHQTRKTYRTYIPVVFFSGFFTSVVSPQVSSPRLHHTFSCAISWWKTERFMAWIRGDTLGAAGTSLANIMRGYEGRYPLVNIQKAIGNGHRNSGFSHEKWVDLSMAKCERSPGRVTKIDQPTTSWKIQGNFQTLGSSRNKYHKIKWTNTPKKKSELMFFCYSDVFGHANDIFSPCPEQPHVPLAQILGQLSCRLGNFVEPHWLTGKSRGWNVYIVVMFLGS